MTTEGITRLDRQARELDHATPEEILRWALHEPNLSEGLSLACSFGMQSVVLVDMLHRLGLLDAVEVFYLDTGLLFEETLEVRERLADRYGLQPVRLAPDLTLEAQASAHGDNLWETAPDACCRLRKVEPMRRYLETRTGWITGMRRAHSSGRAEIPVVLWDGVNGLVKLNPLARWDDKTVWRYVHAHDVPYNRLYDAGYPSIGCMPCTRPVRAGEDPRSGRWAGRDKSECGIHVDGHAVRSLSVLP